MSPELTLILTVTPERIQAATAPSGLLFDLPNMAAFHADHPDQLEVGIKAAELARSPRLGAWPPAELEWLQPFGEHGIETGVALRAVQFLLVKARSILYPSRKNLPPLPPTRLELAIPGYEVLPEAFRRRFELDLALLPGLNQVKLNARDLSGLFRQARWGRRTLKLAHGSVLLVCLVLFNFAFRSGDAFRLLDWMPEPVKTIAAIGLVGAALLGLYFAASRGAAALWAWLARGSLAPALARRLVRGDPNLHADPEWIVRNILS